MKFKLSLHSHTSDFARLVFFTVNKTSYMKKLVDTLLKKSDKDTTLVLGIANSNDNSHYEKIISLTKKLPKNYTISKKFKDHYISISKRNKRIFLVKTDEIGTSEGHVLIIGFKGKIKSGDLKTVLRKAHKQNCIIIANHPLHEFMVPHFILEKIFGFTRRMSMKKPTLLKNKKDLDAIELNSYFPEDWRKIKSFAKKNKFQLVSDSDAHFIDEIFRSWYETSHLDFSAPEKFKRSLKHSLKKNLHLYARPYGFEAKYRHALHILIDSYGGKLGLVKTE